ncbi:hypothetical protein [Catalinimonas alkaloidigena]|nr:hypothetical protein [Catalinimonas alkaloidigena]
MKIHLLLLIVSLLCYSCSSTTKKEPTKAGTESHIEGEHSNDTNSEEPIMIDNDSRIERKNSSDSKSKELPKTSSEDRIEGKYPNDVNSMVSIIDTTMNPFANGLRFSSGECEHNIEAKRIHCVISKFPDIPLPMHFGPIPEINLNSDFEIKDSIFITKALRDSNYFTEEERQYSYYFGVNIPNNYDFETVIIPEWFSVGKSYILLTISSSGENINKLVIGSESSDHESVFGKIESLNDIEVTTKKFGYDKEKDLLYFSSSITEEYRINDKGEILKK